MGSKPKVRSNPRKPTKTAKKVQAQRARFIKAAHAIGFDESGNEFEQALAKIVRARKAIP